MQHFPSADAAVITDELVATLPKRLLLTIARQGGQREHQLAAELTRWLPTQVRSADLRAWVAAILDWFVARGDIERSPGNRYSCVPPYLIGAISNDRPSDLWLCGDPRVAQRIDRELGPLGVALREIPVTGPVGETGAAAVTSPLVPLGLERTVRARAGMRAPIASRLDTIGLALINPDDLAAALPTLDVLVPPAQAAAPNLVGDWQRYEPASQADDRWISDANWPASTAQLVRWCPTDDWQGRRAARLFYHRGGGAVAELGPEAAAVWQLRLDSQAVNSRMLWRDGTTLCAPGILPSATLQWLRLLVGPGSAARFHYGWLFLPLDGPTADRACTLLVDTYKLRLRHGQPPRPPFAGRPIGR